MTDDEDLQQAIIQKFWPQIRAAIQAFQNYSQSGQAKSYSVIEIPQLELGRTVLDFIGLAETDPRDTKGDPLRSLSCDREASSQKIGKAVSNTENYVDTK
jgi:hypothetical protein